jgi:predicted nucleic acid-binding protein
LEYVLDLNAFLAYLIGTHPKHKSVKKALSKASKILIPDILIIKLQWVVLSKRYPELDRKVFKETMKVIQMDPLIVLAQVTPQVAEEQMKWYRRLPFFDAYYAAFSVVYKKKLLTTDPDFKPYRFAEVI